MYHETYDLSKVQCTSSLPIASEVQQILKVSLPLAGNYLVEMLFILTDMIIVGKLGINQLAALSISADTYFSVLVCFMSGLSIFSVTISRNLSENAVGEIQTNLISGMILVISLSMLSLIFSAGFISLLNLIKANPEIIAYSQSYLNILRWSAFPILAMTLLRQFSVAMSRTKKMQYIALFGVVLNGLLNWILVFGLGTFKGFGLVGAAWGTVTVYSLMCILTLISCWQDLIQINMQFQVGFHAMSKIIADLISALRSGIPLAGVVLLDHGFMTFISLLASRADGSVLAAIQVASNLGFYLPTLSIAIGEVSAARIAYHAGKSHIYYACKVCKKIVNAALCIVILTGVVFSCVTYLFQNNIIHFISGEDFQLSNNKAAIFREYVFIMLFTTNFESIQILLMHILKVVGLNKNIFYLWFILAWLFAVPATIGIVCYTKYSYHGLMVPYLIMMILLCIALTKLYRDKFI